MYIKKLWFGTTWLYCVPLAIDSIGHDDIVLTQVIAGISEHG